MEDESSSRGKGETKGWSRLHLAKEILDQTEAKTKGK